MAALLASAGALAFQEQELREHSAELESWDQEEEEEDEGDEEEEEEVHTDATSGTQPSLEAAHDVDRMLGSASTVAAAPLPPTLDDTLWEEDDDDEGFSGWTPWSPASFKMAGVKSSGTPSTRPVGISSQ
ncbi:unnamed protein product [Prorocentrum cordatum]|uniref:Uncharacterized protein n=1 Tax=Prorocentrum cordatum TaxID=2364126 RepID=A0ABN9VAL4_9DINO|nr:unnamed protein product [Polarella glacialis]|mmetsp:Transcript_76465/g.213741  ORF Transcript_76465/g.213741 Transcript_76465/m.213741 type:complete len:130 (-) Transcript_76465:233-622(-)